MNDVLRATVILNTRPSEEREAELAASIVEQYAEDDVLEYAWEIRDVIPDGIPVALADQLDAHKRDAGVDACVMIVYMK